MPKRFTWLLGIAILVLLALLVACGSEFKPAFDGLLIVPSQGFALVQTFSFDLKSGAASEIASNPPVSSVPNSVVLDPAQQYAYVISTQSAAVQGSQNLISSFKVEPGGTLTPSGTTTLNPIPEENGATTAPAVPKALTIDSKGNYLFVADIETTDGLGNQAQGAVSVFSVVGNGTLTEVQGSPFTLPPTVAGTIPDPVALSVSPTIFPAQSAACSLQPPP